MALTCPDTDFFAKTLDSRQSKGANIVSTWEWSGDGTCEEGRVAASYLAVAVKEKGWVESTRLGGAVDAKSISAYSEELWKLLGDFDPESRARGEIER